jgi:hypothetical protein
MRRFALLVGLATAAVAYAQHRGVIRPGHGPGNTYGSRHGFGNVVFPGTGSPPPIGPIPTSGFAYSLGGIVSGFRPYTGEPVGRYRGRLHRFAYVPVAYPVYVGGYYPDYPPQPPAQVTIVNQAAPPPQIIINNQVPPQEPAKPVVREYGPDSWKGSAVSVYEAPVSQAAEGRPIETAATVYLIAFRDGVIYPAIAMWVEEDTLHYITKDGKPNKASMALVDREFSRKLNHERGLEIPLPAL